MTSVRNFISPSHLNLKQRQGFFMSVALAALILLLHFPFDGYDDIEHLVITRYGSGECPPHMTIELMREMTAEEIVKVVDARKQCSNDEEMQLRSPLEWKSKAPIVPWFGSLLHAIVALSFSLALGAFWIWTFRTQKK